MKKMRILTFMSIGAEKPEISFEELAKTVDINMNDVEGFVIDGMYTSGAAKYSLQTIFTACRPRRRQSDLQSVQCLMTVEPTHPFASFFLLQPSIHSSSEQESTRCTRKFSSGRVLTHYP